MGSASTAGRKFGGTDLLLLLTAVMWGTNFSVLKVGLADVSPLLFAVGRFVLALAMLLPLAWLTGSSLRIEPRLWPRLIGVGLLGNSLYMLLFVHGAARTSADNAALILATVPVWVVIITSATGTERVTPRGWCGVGLSLAGVVGIVVGSDAGTDLEFGGPGLVGDLLVLLATWAWSGYSVLVRPLVERCSPVSITVLATAVGTVPLVLLALPLVPLAQILSVPSRGWTTLTISALIGIVLPYLFWNQGIRRLGSARTSLYSYLVPPIALVVAGIWLGETLAPAQLLGAALVLVGVVMARQSVRPISGAEAA